MTFRSFSDSSTLLRSGPAMTRSMASSSASIVICLPLDRAVSNAPSLITLARSAPVNPGVHREDPLAAGQVGLGHHDLAVEAAGAEQRRVEDVGSVGGRDHDDAALGVEAVQLDQHLVQRLLALVMAAAEAGAAVPTHGVDLVDEHDRRGVRLGLLEQVADP